MNFDLLKKLSTLHNLNGINKVEKKEVIDFAMQHKEDFVNPIGLETLITIAETDSEFFDEFPDFNKFLFEKIKENGPMLGRELSFLDSIKLVTYLDRYEAYLESNK